MEDDVVQSSTAPAEPAQNIPAEPVPHLEIDDRTGKRTVVMKAPEPAEKEPEEEPKPQEPPTAEPAQEPEPPKEGPNLINKIAGTPKPFYKADELMLAMQLGNVDESRIPPEIKPRYDAATKPKQPTQEEAERAVREKIQSMAREEAMKKSGISEDDLQLGEFSDDPDVQKRIRDYHTAYELAQQKIIRDSLDRYKQMQAAEQSRKEVMQDVKRFIDEQRAKEPHFDEIGKLMETKFQEMPFKQAAVIEPVLRSAVNGTLTAQQAEVLGQYYDICRKELYAKINKTSVTPQPIVPKVEGRGAGLSTDTSKDYAKLLREASVREKPRILAEWINNQRRN